MSWAWIAIALGVLIILTRAPLVLRPAETLRAWDRIFFGTKTRVRMLGAVYIAIAAACFLEAEGERGGVAGFLLVVAGVCFGGALVTLLAPDVFRTFLRAFEPQPSLTRSMGALAVLIGALLVYVGVRAL